MVRDPSDVGSSLVRELEERVLRTTHGRIRELSVAEEQGKVVLRGRVPSYHTRQLALQAVLDLISGERFRDCITVG